MLFDSIAPIYALFFNRQVKYYKKVLSRMESRANIASFKKVLDFGCGTGALSYALNQPGIQVTGVDTSQGMLKQANKRLKSTDIKLLRINAYGKLPFGDDSFDLAISSFVIHGMETSGRKWVYKELSRVSKGGIIFHDYNKNRSWITDIAEFLERGDYFNFIKVAEEEMREHFNKVRILQVDKRAAWYIVK